eukprot:UN28359
MQEFYMHRKLPDVINQYIQCGDWVLWDIMDYIGDDFEHRKAVLRLPQWGDKYLVCMIKKCRICLKTQFKQDYERRKNAQRAHQFMCTNCGWLFQYVTYHLNPPPNFINWKMVVTLMNRTFEYCKGLNQKSKNKNSFPDMANDKLEWKSIMEMEPRAQL